MMFHNKYTMPLSRLSLMLETGNISLICRFRYLPRFVTRYWYIRFMQVFDDMFTGDGSEMNDEVVRVMMWNKIKNILPAMYSLLVTEDNKYAAELFESYYGHPPKGTDDLELIRNDIKRLSKRYNMLTKKKPDNEVLESVTFENIIQGVEAVLEKPHIPRDIRLYQFEEYYKLSLRRIAEIKAHRHGKN